MILPYKAMPNGLRDHVTAHVRCIADVIETFHRLFNYITGRGVDLSAFVRLSQLKAFLQSVGRF